MTTKDARNWIVYASLICTGATFAFLIVAPSLGYPLGYNQTIRITQIILPVFLGYLGAAVYFVLDKAPPDPAGSIEPMDANLLIALVRGPVYLFAIGCSAAFVSFGYSNRVDAPPGAGMGVDALASILTTATSILAASTSFLVARLFRIKG